MINNRLITFEGIDGSGKSTQINLLNEWFDSLGINKINIREPGGNNVSELIRTILLNKANTINSFSEMFLNRTPPLCFIKPGFKLICSKSLDILFL